LKQEIGEHAAAAAAATAQAHSLQVELQVRDTCRTHRAHICSVLMGGLGGGATIRCCSCRCALAPSPASLIHLGCLHATQQCAVADS
jgi:hypothetical protein